MKFLIYFILLVGIAFAQKPVRIDAILTETNHLKLDSTFSYSNIQNSSNLSASQIFQTQNGDFVTIPAYLGISKSNRDYLDLDLTLRYGLTNDIEVFVSLNGYNSDTKNTLSSGVFQNESDKGFNALSLGVTYQVKPEDATPSLLLGVSTQVIEKTKIEEKSYSSNFKNYRFFATSFYTVDPVVFLVSTSYNFNKTKHLGTLKRDDANIFTLAPQVYFAVNPYTSLNWGVKYNYFGKTKIDNRLVGNSGSTLSFLTGVSYEFSANTFISINAEYLNTNTQSQNTFAVTLSYTF